MKRKHVISSLPGIPSGVFIGYTLTILFSMGENTGSYLPVKSELLEIFEQLTAVFLQYLAFGILGFIYMLLFHIWNEKYRNTEKQLVHHFCILSSLTLPFAYLFH